MIRNPYAIAGGAVAALVASLTTGLGFALSGSAHRLSQAAIARQAALEFFRTINARQFDRTCDLLATEFYRRNHVPSKARCALALRIEYTWAPTYRFRIVGVRVDGRRALADALANGVPGQVVLVREGGRFKVLSVRGG